MSETLWGVWGAQSVKLSTLAQVVISQFVGSSPVSGSVLTAQSLELALDSVSPSLSVPPRLKLCLSKINKPLKKKKGMIHATTWMNPEDMLSEINPTQRPHIV